MKTWTQQMEALVVALKRGDNVVYVAPQDYPFDREKEYLERIFGHVPANLELLNCTPSDKKKPFLMGAAKRYC